jgi:hypothetical protein
MPNLPNDFVDVIKNTTDRLVNKDVNLEFPDLVGLSPNLSDDMGINKLADLFLRKSESTNKNTKSDLDIDPSFLQENPTPTISKYPIEDKKKTPKIEFFLKRLCMGIATHRDEYVALMNKLYNSSEDFVSFTVDKNWDKSGECTFLVQYAIIIKEEESKKEEIRQEIIAKEIIENAKENLEEKKKTKFRRVTPKPINLEKTDLPE